MKWVIIISIIVILIMFNPLKALSKTKDIYKPFSPFNPFNWQSLPLINKVPGDKEAFGTRVIEIANELKVTPDSLMAIMDFESAGSFQADKWGGYNGRYVGLIQFGSDAANDLNTSQNYLANLTNVQQLEYVLKYFKMWTQRLKVHDIDGIADLYLMVLYPRAVQIKDRYTDLGIPGQQASILYQDGKITKNSITAMFQDRYPNNFLS